MPAASAPVTPRRPVAAVGPPVAPSSPVGSQGSVGDVSCAICLEHAEQEQLAMVKGCDHSYCGACDATYRNAKPLSAGSPLRRSCAAVPRQGSRDHLVSTRFIRNAPDRLNVYPHRGKSPTRNE